MSFARSPHDENGIGNTLAGAQQLWKGIVT
jgi:hypothetical protein